MLTLFEPWFDTVLLITVSCTDLVDLSLWAGCLLSWFCCPFSRVSGLRTGSVDLFIWEYDFILDSLTLHSAVSARSRGWGFCTCGNGGSSSSYSVACDASASAGSRAAASRTSPAPAPIRKGTCGSSSARACSSRCRDPALGLPLRHPRYASREADTRGRADSSDSTPV